MKLAHKENVLEANYFIEIAYWNYELILALSLERVERSSKQMTLNWEEAPTLGLASINMLTFN